MALSDGAIRVLIHNVVNAKLTKNAKDIKAVSRSVEDTNNKLTETNTNTSAISKDVESLKKSVKTIQDLLVTDGDGTKYLSDDGTYKTLVLEDGSDVDENIALIVTQNQEAIKTLNGTGVGSVEYKIRQAFAIDEIVE